jgi:hypothetical protein
MTQTSNVRNGFLNSWLNYDRQGWRKARNIPVTGIMLTVQLQNAK